MIVLDKPQITDLFIPRTGCADAAIKKGCFNRKDIMTLLSNYITVESATTILDDIFIDYIQGDNNLTELILNAVGDVYTREQVDTMISGLQAKIDDLQEQIDNMTGYTPTPPGPEPPTPDTGSTTPDSGLTPDFSGNTGRNKYFTLEPIADDAEFQFIWDNGDQLSFMYRIDDGDWTEAHFAENITVPAGSRMEMKGNNYKYAGNRISADKPFKVSGNIFSLVAGDDFYYGSGFDVNGFQNFFAGAFPLTDASGLYLGDRYFGVPAWGYSQFFANCTGLTAAPELPMNGIDQYGYYEMFYGCTSLEKAPVLPAVSVGEQAYTEMFWGCSNLHYINCNLRDSSDAAYNWVGGNVIPSDGVFIGSPDANWKTGYNGVPNGWAYYEYDLEASTNYISTDLDGGEITFTISSNSYWSIDFEDDWFTINRVRGQEGEDITLRVTIPAGDTTRIGVLRISNTYKTIEIPVVRSNQRFVFFDDFPDGTSEDWGYTTSYDPDFVSEFYDGQPNIESYLDHYFDTIDNETLDSGVNMYALIGSMEFNNKTYWVYQYMTEWGRFGDGDNTNMTYALLDVTRTDIKSKSLRADYRNIYEHHNCFDHFLGTDGIEYDSIPEKEGADIYVIVDVQ